jgi:hypothetical protein
MDLPQALEQFVPQYNTLFLNLKTTDPEQLVAEEHPFGWVLRVLQQEDATTEAFVEALKVAVSQLDELPEEDRNQWEQLMYYLVLLILHRRDVEEQPALLSVVNETVTNNRRREEVSNMGRTAAQALMAEGREQGFLQARQEALLDVIQSKFGAVPQTIEQQIQAIRDLNRLRELTRRVPTANSLEELNLVS